MKLIIPVEKKPDKEIQWSPYQKSVFNAVENRTDNLLVQAVAGSGKTTTILECMNRAPRNKNTGFVAFNRAIADELASKVPANVTSKTLHSIGFAALRNLGYKMNKAKTRSIFQDICKAYQVPDDDYYEMLPIVKRIIGLLKANLLDEDISTEEVMIIAETNGCPMDATKARLVRTVWEEGDKGKWKKIIDFDDMLRTPVMLGIDLPTFDLLFVDEAQDLNRIQHKMVSKMLGPNSRIIAVGDRNQAIYGFRGASTTSMDDMSMEFNMHEMPLSISYRCSVEVLEEARKFHPGILGRSGAPKGGVLNMHSTELYKNKFNEEESHLVIGRYNYSIFKAALRMRLYNQRTYLMGKDIVPMVIGVAKLIVKEMGDLTENWVYAYAKKHMDKRGGEAVIDNCNIIQLCMSEGCVGVAGIENMLYTMFPKQPPSGFHVPLCTIHKSKGLEADNIYFLDKDQMPVDLGCEKNIGQEGNLMYVMITRAKERLYYVS